MYTNRAVDYRKSGTDITGQTVVEVLRVVESKRHVCKCIRVDTCTNVKLICRIFYLHFILFFICNAGGREKTARMSKDLYLFPCFPPSITNVRSRHDMNSVCIVSFWYDIPRDDGNF